MYVQKGFISNTLYTNNTPGQVALIGELSTYSTTFSREKGIYSDTVNAPNLVLTSFISSTDSTAVPLPSVISQQILDIATYVYSFSLTDITAGDLLENLLQRYLGAASDFHSGNMLSDDVHTLPEWLSWNATVLTSQPDNLIKIWFSDDSFRLQYDEFEIVVIPPTDTLDNFFLPGAQVEAMLKVLTSSENTDRMQAAKNGNPETIMRTNTYAYIDPVNPAHTVNSDWGLLIYGPSGDNVDSIKDALIAYILANSSYSRDDWAKILPDIFKRTEFILVPNWNSYAIPNRELQTGIYSPQIGLVAAATLVKQIATLYPAPHIDLYASVMGFPYRSVAILSVGSPDNRGAQYRLSDVFPDLIAVTSTSADFNRMTKTTQDWARDVLYDLIIRAETVGPFTTVPQGVNKLTRNGILYLTRSYMNINYLVVAKSNFPLVPTVS